MKIAVATMDGIAMSQHFGQSAGFVVFEVEGTEVKRREVRMNDRTPHAQGLCNHGQEGHGQGRHNHAGIAGLLQDCQVVLCGGMGGGAAQALQQLGVQPIVLTVQGNADDVVSLYLKGAVEALPGGFCACHH